MSTIETERPANDVARSQRLRGATRSAHDGLDAKIMALDPFSSRARYGLLLKVQHGFHRDIDALYGDPALGSILADLAGRRRLGLIEEDLADLQADVPVYEAPARFCAGVSAELPNALGWLYVAEGSNLGAAILLKQAARLDLSTAFGARHLAGSPQGRARHWRGFVAALDAAELSARDEADVIDGAKAAFDRVSGLVDAVFGG